MEYYKVKVKHPSTDSVKDEFKGRLTYDQIAPYLSSHKVPGYWSFNPHDWGETNVEVRIFKITETEI